jgi:leucyl aminopeptidase
MSLSVALTQDPITEIRADSIVVGVHENGTLSPSARTLDAASGGLLKRLIERGDISGKASAITRLFDVAGMQAPRLVLVGLGDAATLDAPRYLKALAEAAKALKAANGEVVSFLGEAEVRGRDAAWKLRQHVTAFSHHHYRYTATRGRKGAGDAGIKSLSIASEAGADLENSLALAAGIELTRELGNLPPNICTPQYLAETAQRLATTLPNFSTEIIERDEMEKLGMGSLLAVARGSANAPRLIVMKYQGAAADAAPYVLVGKGITFDSGGISIKPGASMDEMKYDMCGGAAVFGTLHAAAAMALPVNVIGVVPAVENMPDGNAYRPGDVLTSMSGLTIEVLNTDAEGRLILCDAITYARRFKPHTLIDIATLTGACVVALGKHAHGLMTHDDALADELLKAGERVHDRAWRLPIWDDYQPMLDSGFADMANIGGRSAGAITAACFLSRFATELRWAHLDIAGTAWDEGRKGSATGRPVQLLVQWLIDRAG